MGETLRDTLDANRSLVKNVEQLLQEYRSAQQRFAALQTELQERVIAFQKQSEMMLGDARKSANALVAAVERSVKTIADDLQSAHKANEASIRELAARQAELADTQRHYLKQQEAALGRFADELALLPTRRYQLVSIGILGLNTVLVAIAVFYVLSRNA
jgi:hypothetical protein